ncbi:hypothetical protein BCR33DRAFT_718644 [Rhizoclosmatium globosum]|uniref:Uncharacterized protein n=1 Tax=Rhizoclosmatium globosum TaxID=329046 RepID=A0A1Y2C4S4_9FUNG|nr:hypothetical protein BCR33DRAFT_718644 [Rhizoclosmatium globosum]|eukprot:ORY42011.1 hypothetical protein BCR33DRAFT_718644 [Rhizoclosmatium globosum]
MTATPEFQASIATLPFSIYRGDPTITPTLVYPAKLDELGISKDDFTGRIRMLQRDLNRHRAKARLINLAISAVLIAVLIVFAVLCVGLQYEFGIGMIIVWTLINFYMILNSGLAWFVPYLSRCQEFASIWTNEDAEKRLVYKFEYSSDGFMDRWGRYLKVNLLILEKKETV